MTRVLTGLLGTIAAGVLVIAYALLNPPARVEALGDERMTARPWLVSDRPAWSGVPDPYPGLPDPRAALAGGRWQPDTVAAVRPVAVSEPAPAPRRAVQAVRKPARNWKKTAAVIGGTAAAGAGIGALAGGKKGALIGAVIGGGAAVVYDNVKR